MTRVGFISDIHVDVNAKACGALGPASLIAAEARRAGLDILVIAGDISSDWSLSLETADRIRDESGAAVLFVPGNHDVWTTHHAGTGSQAIYDRMLAHPGNLAARPFFPDDRWAILGDTGWYDYSFGDPSFTRAEFESMRHGRKMWQDRVRADWGRADLEVHGYFMERLRASLGAAGGRRTILVTHVVQAREFIVPPLWKSWHYFNAFLGSPDYGDLATGHGVSMSVFGHVHFRKRLLKGTTEFICPCLGYARQWWDPDDPEKEIRDSLVVRELQ